MKRLLLYFSYIGTNYRGLQTTRTSSKFNLSPVQRAPDLDSVQGVLEFGLKKVLHVTKGVSLHTSSRTDVGVHAVESTVQFDLDELALGLQGKGGYSPERICQTLNLFLEKNECDIRIKRVVEVPSNFNCRRASSRVYEFRVALLNEYPPYIYSHNRISSAANIKDLHRCEAVLRPFDIKTVQDACQLFIGQWDFSTFMKSTREVVEPDMRVKTILRFSLTPEVIADDHWDSFIGNVSKQPYDIYTFTIEGSGFLRRQVRRMVGALVGVGQGRITSTDIFWMLKNPRESNWNEKVPVLGPNGLFLRNINYSNLNIVRGYLS